MRINKKVEAQTMNASESVCIGTALTSTDVHAAVSHFLLFQNGKKIIFYSVSRKETK